MQSTLARFRTMTSTRAAIGAAAVLVAVLGLLVAAPAFAAGERQATLGADGEVYVAHGGPLGELFPDQPRGLHANPSLAIDVTASDGTVQRLLVPGTQANDLESTPDLVFDNASRTLFVLWQSRSPHVYTHLNLVTLRDGEWGEVIEVSGNPFAVKGSPQIALSQDTFTVLDDAGEPRVHERRVIHLVWWEEGSEALHTFYAPLVLIDGEYVGWNPVVRLDPLIADAVGTPGETPAESLVTAPRILPGRDGRSVVLAFVDDTTGRLVTLEVTTVPGEIAYLAGRVRAQIVDLGARHFPRDLERLGGEARAQIVDLGARLGFHPAVPAYLASQVADAVAQADPAAGLENLADDARAQIVDLGARFTNRGFDRPFDRHAATSTGAASEALDDLFEFPVDPGATDEAAPSILRFHRTADLPAPAVGEGSATLYLSETGADIVVAWDTEDAVVFRERTSDGWSEPRTLRLGQTLDRSKAHEVLNRRVQDR